MPNHDRTAAIHQLLRGLDGLDPLKRLFWSELNYERINQPIPRRQWTENQRALLAEDPVLFAGAGDDQGFQVIYSKLASDRLLLTPERTVVSRLQAEHPYALFVFSNRDQDRWHFVNVKQQARDAAPQREGSRKAPQLFRRITVGPEERLRTASERVAMLDVAGVTGSLFGVAPLDIQARHDEAFDVEAVTRQFFDGYKSLFGIIQDDLARQTGDSVWAHDYALQFLNRLMFLYFVQRKRWLGDETEFLKVFWEAYQDSGQPRDTFFPDWLSILFFEAFNNRFHGGHQQFPEPIRNSLQMAPYLNGGLFRENHLDTHPPRPFSISDDRFKQAYGFLESYNFTIAEDSPLDQEVAVDPEMIGKVYESLVNVSSEADERGDAGIFYTPRTEIDLMCRLALVDNVANHLGPQHKNLLYEVVFALEPEDKEAADSRVQAAGLWDHLDDRLRETTVVDPACGSGSFLVGMLHVLDDLQARAARHLGTSEDPYDRKKRIIGQSLYGVDVMEWACHVAELRLWLALIIDADIDTTAAHVRREPLLPHFSFKVRCGDSLVQEVGGLNMAHIKGSDLVPPPVKRKITIHKERKLQFYNNDEDREYKTEEQVKQAELLLFREILDAQDKAVEQQVTQLNQRIANPKARQIRLDGTVEATPQMALEAAGLQRQVAELEGHRERLQETRQALQSVHDVPFVWDIAFVEVFEGDSGGFDIVVGNPPYVRQEQIADPRLAHEAVTEESKQEYKAKLARSVYQQYPAYFRYNAGKDIAGRRLNAKSDLYVYFYLHGLSLLNPHGSFCFVTSNSWLDVGYGADLQEFLLRQCRIKLILDNEVRRVFSSADVNTVIVLFSAPGGGEADRSADVARFVMLTVPFERIVDPVIFEEIEESEGQRTTPDYRVYAATQQQLFDAGCDAEESDECARPGANGRARKAKGPLLAIAKYSGDKWGGKYLRAPDIYWQVLEKGSGKLVRLGDVAEVRRGFTTGANEFFYLPSRFFDISEDGDHYRLLPKVEGLPTHLAVESGFLEPCLLHPGDVLQPTVTPQHVESLLLVLDVPRPELAGVRASEYVAWGESQGFHETATCAARGRSSGEWYRLRRRSPADLFIPIINKMRLALGINAAQAQSGDNCVEVRAHADVPVDALSALLLGSFNFVSRHQAGRSYGRMLKVQTCEAERLLVCDPRLLTEAQTEELLSVCEPLLTQAFSWLRDDLRTPERVELDRAWLRVHGFADGAELDDALAAIHAAVERLSDEMNAQEEAWTKVRGGVRRDGNPQDVMKGKKRRR